MAKQFFRLIIFLSPLWAFSQSPSWMWAKGFGLYGYDAGKSIATDANGNSYVTGKFSGTVNFGSFTLSTPNSFTDVFVAKYDALGNVLWAYQAGGSEEDLGNSICIDQNGNCYVTGSFTSPVFNCGSFTLFNTNPQPTYRRDMFVAKYDNNGNVLWARKADGVADDEGFGICTDPSGNVVVVGSYESDTLDFSGSYVVNTTLGGFLNVFIVKYDQNGNVLWTDSPYGNDTERAYSVSSDGLGNIYVTGYFMSPNLTFDNVVITNTWSQGGVNNVFVAKYNSTGLAIWAKRSAGIGWGIKTDSAGNSFVAGEFFGSTITFGSITLANTNPGSDDAFLFKFNTAGTCLWGQNVGGPGDESGRGVSIDSAGNTYIAGGFSSDSIIIGNDILDNPTLGYSELFVGYFNSSGSPLWGKSATGWNYYDYALGIGNDNSGNSYVTGYFNSPAIAFDTITVSNASFNGGEDIFVARISSLTGLNEIGRQSDLSIFPNPSTGIFTVEGSGTIFIYDLLGLNMLTFKTTVNRTTVDLQDIPAGFYIVRLTDGNNTRWGQALIQK